MKTAKNNTAAVKASDVRALRMRPVHLRKLAAITEVKGKALFSKNFIIMPIFSIGFTFLMKVVYDRIAEGALDMSAYALSLGVLMNILMEGIYCTAAALAEEKEKNTLRTLMTSSVNGLEFFLGSFIPVLLMCTAVNVLCALIAGVSMDASQWAAYLAVATACAAISTVIGMIFGIYAKTQVSASTITTPALLVLMMLPIFSGFSEILEQISGFLFTGIVFEAIANINSGLPVIDIQSGVILSAEFILSVILFLALYRKNGFER